MADELDMTLDRENLSLLEHAARELAEGFASLPATSLPNSCDSRSRPARRPRA